MPLGYIVRSALSLYLSIYVDDSEMNKTCIPMLFIISHGLSLYQMRCLWKTHNFKKIKFGMDNLATIQSRMLETITWNHPTSNLNFFDSHQWMWYEMNRTNIAIIMSRMQAKSCSPRGISSSSTTSREDYKQKAENKHRMTTWRSSP